MNDNHLMALLRLNRLPIAGRREITEKLLAGESPQEIEKSILEENFADRGERLREIFRMFNAETEMERAERSNIWILPILSSDYPEQLRRIFNPPWILYGRGKIIPEDSWGVAMVGTRHPSFYGVDQARKFAHAFAESGLTVISGLARGIDEVSHSSALDISHGRTLAVLGCGVDICYPKENKKIYEKILERGAVISEYSLGTEPRPQYFPQRNRILAGLSTGVLVIEAHYRSGALITAHEAVEEGCEVFAIPGPVDQLTSRGTHRLIKEGAALVESPQDVLEVILPKIQETNRVISLNAEKSQKETKDVPAMAIEPRVVASQEEASFIEKRLKEGPCRAEEWMENHSAGELMAELTRLEILGRIEKRPDGAFQKKS